MLQIEELELRCMPSSPSLGPGIVANQPEMPAINLPQYNANLGNLTTFRQQLHDDGGWYGQLMSDRVQAMIADMPTSAISQTGGDLYRMRIELRLASHDLAVASAQNFRATLELEACRNSTDPANKLFFARRCNNAIAIAKAALAQAQLDLRAAEAWGSAAQSLLEVYVD
jgi:hypothetical protein